MPSMPVAAIPPAVVTQTALGRIEHVDAGRGPAFLAVHGGMGGCDQSWLLARSLLGNVEAHRVLAVSRPGYLGSAPQAGTRPDDHADACAALLDAHGIESAVVAAVSAGGPTALRFALRHPRRCRALLLVSAVTGPFVLPREVGTRLRWMGRLARIPGLPRLLRWRVLRDPERTALRSIGDEAQAARTSADPVAGPLMRALQASIFERMPSRLDGTAADIAALEAAQDVAFERLAVPVFAVHGTADRVVPPAHLAALEGRAPDLRTLWIEGGRHAVLFSHLHEIRAEAARFLAAVAAGETAPASIL